MTVQVNIAKAKATLSELVARAEAGEEVVLMRNGKPVATIQPTANKPKAKRVAGAWAHLGPMEDPYLFGDYILCKPTVSGLGGSPAPPARR